MNREYFKKRLDNAIANGDFDKELEKMVGELGNDHISKQELIWAAADLAKEKRTHEAMAIARAFRFDPDPADDDKYSQEVKDGKDVRAIVTVRGALCWLLQYIIATLESAYFGEILDILTGENYPEDKKQFALSVGKNYYIRQQSTVPLEMLAANMRAVKNRDETPFDFGRSSGRSNRERTEELIWKMFRENRDLPRVMEYLTNVFGRMRHINKDEALDILNLFFYNSKGKLNDDYLIERVAPLAIFFSEFRAGAANDGFESSAIVSFFKKTLEEAGGTYRSGVLWHFWQACKDNSKNYEKIKKYLPIIFKPPFHPEIIGQIDFLVEIVIENDLEEGLQLLDSILQYIKLAPKTNQFNKIENVWLMNSESILRKVLEKKPEKYCEYLEKLITAGMDGAYIGNYGAIFSMHKGIDKKFLAAALECSKKLYDQAKGRVFNLPDIAW